jgi:hypothetical protein
VGGTGRYVCGGVEKKAVKFRDYEIGFCETLIKQFAYILCVSPERKYKGKARYPEECATLRVRAIKQSPSHGNQPAAREIVI